MKALVTGAAGFIGSHLVDELLRTGARVTGIDAFTEYYASAEKQRNLERAGRHRHFELVTADLCEVDLAALLSDVDVVFHQAAQPGVRPSWSEDFTAYTRQNLMATHALLEACRANPVARLVYASSSSVYGNADVYPCEEAAMPKPFSPYGVTKLAAEHLCKAYASNFGLSTVSLRYFTVFGPRQRPDMAFRRLIDAALTHRPFPLYGDGRQIRDFTYVDDVVAANLAAAASDAEPGSVFNIAGGASTDMRTVIDLVGDLTGSQVALDRRPGQPGDVRRTGGDIARARRELGWQPIVELSDGLRRQAEWQRSLPRS